MYTVNPLLARSACTRGDVHDRAVSVAQHVRDRGAAQLEGNGGVQQEGVRPRFVAHVYGRSVGVPCRGRVVHQHADAAERVGRVGHELFARTVGVERRGTNAA